MIKAIQTSAQTSLMCKDPTVLLEVSQNPEEEAVLVIHNQEEGEKLRDPDPQDHQDSL